MPGEGTSLRNPGGRSKNGAVQARVLPAAAILAVWVCGLAPAQRPARAGSAAIVAPAARIDINSASVTELMKVPGMTRSWAGRIVRFRPYRSKQDLLDRGVVTGTVYERIKGYIIAHRKPR